MSISARSPVEQEAVEGGVDAVEHHHLAPDTIDAEVSLAHGHLAAVRMPPTTHEPRLRRRRRLPRYDREVERGVHDRGGWPGETPVDRTEHELADWEMLMDAIVGALSARGVMNVDELRRGIEAMPPAEYESASYYERWLFAVETVLTEKGVLAPGAVDARTAT